MNEIINELARIELKPLQANIMVKLEDGTMKRAAWDYFMFRDWDTFKPFDKAVVDFWTFEPMPDDKSVTARAKAELKPYQSNIDVRTANGSLLRAQWDTVNFIDHVDGEPIPDVVDFHVDHTQPTGGFTPQCKP